MFKICCRCDQERSRGEFTPDKKSSDGLQSWCKPCYSAYKKLRRETKGDALRAQERALYHLHKDYYRKYYQDNKDTILLRHVEYRSRPETQANLRRLRERPEHKEKKRVYYSNPDVKKRVNNKNAIRKKTDIGYRLRCSLRQRLCAAIKGNQKSGSAVSDLGCSVEHLKHHLESKFQPGMTWNNWGLGVGNWNIDHIMPLIAFNLADRQHFLLASNYLNLQPLWFEENMAKNKAP